MRYVLCSLLLLMVLSGCVQVEIVRDTPASTLPDMMPTPTATPMLDDTATISRILSRGSLVVGTRYDLFPFGYVTEEGELAGFDVELARELARRWLGSAEAVRFRQVRSDTALEHLRNRDVDLVIAALPHTQGGEALADFSLPYFMDGQALLVRQADADVIVGPESLSGLRVGVVAWEDTAALLQGIVPFTLTFQTFDRFDTAVAALARGDVDAVANVRRRLFWGMHLASQTAIVGQYTFEPAAIAYPQSDPAFADLVNLTLQQIVADGTYAALYERWFPSDPPPQLEWWPGSEIPTLAELAVPVAVPDVLETVQTRGRLTVAMVSRAPFAYVDVDGTPTGYEVSLVRLFAERWLGDPTAVDFVPVSFEQGQAMVRQGEAQVLIGGLPHTRASELMLDFSLTTYVAGDGLMVRADAAPVATISDLAGWRIGAVVGGVSEAVLQAAAQAAGIPLVVLPQPNFESALALLQQGEIEAVAGARTDLLSLAHANPGYKVLPLRLTQVPLALALPPGDSEFRDLVNLTLQALKREGLLDNLYRTWFTDAPPELEIWPGDPYRPLRLSTEY